MKYWLFIFFISISVGLSGQKISKTDLFGEWHLVKLTTGSNVVFDLDNLDEIKKKNLATLREVKPNYTEIDSIREVNHIDKAAEDIKKYFFKFEKNNTYSNPKIQGGGTMTDDIEQGKYKLLKDGASLMLIESDGDKTKVELNFSDGVLTMTFNNGDELTIMGFRK